MEKTKTTTTKSRTEQNCQYCGKPMRVAEGGTSVTKMINTLTHRDTGIRVRVKNVDQEAKFHKQCRKMGRRSARMEEKRARQSSKTI